MLGIAARGEGIGLGIVHDVDARHRQAGAAGQPGDDAVVLAAGAFIHLLGAIHAQHHLVGLPQAEHVHRQCDEKGDDHAGLPADYRAHGHEDARQRGEQQPRLGEVGRHWCDP